MKDLPILLCCIFFLKLNILISYVPLFLAFIFTSSRLCIFQTIHLKNSFRGKRRKEIQGGEGGRVRKKEKKKDCSSFPSNPIICLPKMKKEEERLQ